MKPGTWPRRKRSERHRPVHSSGTSAYPAGCVGWTQHRKNPAPIIASDARGDAVSFSIDNARAAGIGHLLRFDKRDQRDFQPPAGPPGVILCNPPYGERLGEEKNLYSLYRLLGEVFAQRCPGWTAFVFSGNPRLGNAIGLKTAAEIPLFNGKIPCRLLKFESK